MNHPYAHLEPCPFCGSEATLTSKSGYDYGSNIYRVSCLNTECHAEISVYAGVTDKFTALTAINRWNRRVNGDAA